MNAKTEAVKNADAELNNAALPTYTEVLDALRSAHDIVAIACAHMTSEQKARFEQDLQARGMHRKSTTRVDVLQRSGEVGYN